MKIDQVLDEYRQGDADKQMSMFLYYREFRAEFTRIEQDDKSGGQGLARLLPSAVVSTPMERQAWETHETR